MVFVYVIYSHILSLNHFFPLNAKVIFGNVCLYEGKGIFFENIF